MAVACGLALSLALPPVGWWPFAFAIAPVFVLVAGAASARAAFVPGFWFAVSFFTVHILWLPRSFAELFGTAFWATFPLLIVVLGVFWGLTCWGGWLLGGGRKNKAPGTKALLTLPVLWVLVEWARTQGYFAFPWGTLGYAFTDTAAAQLAEFVGVYGLSLFITLCAALLAWPFTSTPAGRATAFNAILSVLTVAALLGLAFWQGVERLPKSGQPSAMAPAESLTALLVQGNVDPFARAASAAQELDIHVQLTANAADHGPFDLVVWPEGAVIGYQLGTGDALGLREFISDSAPEATFVVGGRAYVGSRGDSHNSLFSIQSGALLGRYDKQYLVPFGERWPLIDQLEGLYRGVFSMFGLPLLAGTLPGTGQVPLDTTFGPVAAFICYESIFPQVQRSLVNSGAGVLVLGTNDAWFGVGNGAWQHFDMGRMRAIETRRWLLRAGNDGVTASVDPYGRVVAEIPRGQAGTLATQFYLRHDLTFWVMYGQWLPAVLAAWLVMVGLIILVAGRSRVAEGNASF